MKLNTELLAHGDRIAVALSGGADSVCLLLCLLEIAEKFALSLSAIHCNHHLRDESDDDMRFCEGLCARVGVPLIVEHFDVREYAREHGMSIEEAARDMRYAAFLRHFPAAKSLDNGQAKMDNYVFITGQETIAEESPISWKIATAHTLSDNMETVLLNLIRGTALTGLCGIPTQRSNIIRPLLEATRTEVEAFLHEHGQGFVIDKSNLSTEYTRNKIRLEILPKMTEINPALATNFGNTIQALKKDRNFLETITKEAYDRCIVRGRLEVSSFCGEDVAIRARVVARFLGENGFSPDARRIAEVMDVAQKGAGKINLSRNVYLCCKLGIITINAIQQVAEFSAPMVFGEQNFLGRKLTIRLLGREKCKDGENVHTKFAIDSEISLKSLLDYDKIKGNVVARNKRNADSIRFTGRGFTTKLKKLFSEYVAPEDRGRVLLLCDDDGVIYVEGFGVSERVATSETTLQVLEVSIE